MTYCFHKFYKLGIKTKFKNNDVFNKPITIKLSS